MGRVIDRRRKPGVGKAGGVGGDFASLVASFEKREAGARKSNVAREQEIRGIYGDIISRSEEGGAFRESGLADIAREQRHETGIGTQALISGGLFGTTAQSGVAQRAAESAKTSRLKLEDILEQRTTQAKLGLGSFIERIQEPYPDYSQLLQASAAQASNPNQRRGSGVQYR